MLTYGSIIALPLLRSSFSGVIVFQFSPGAYTQTLFTREPVTQRVGIFRSYGLSDCWSFSNASAPLVVSLWLATLPFGTKSLTAYIVHPIP